MLDPGTIVNFLKENEVNFFTGVPDSLLKDFCAYIDDEFSENNHIIAANEGASIGLAIGYHLSTGRIPLVYLQNSGLGNTVNPLMSLASPEVYSIPILLIIGWRGEPGAKDEPQHIHQGRITPDLLNAMGIPYIVIDPDMHENDIFKQFGEQLKICKLKKQPVCVIVKKGTFNFYKKKSNISKHMQYKLEREKAVELAVNECENNSIIICTTGMLSRELFEFRAKNNSGHGKDFLCVGGMGHASQIATTIAINQPHRPVYCFDGDGALLMHMGSMAITGTKDLPNFIHIVFNNGCHESVGGQPTVAQKIVLSKVASSLGYKFSKTVKDEFKFINVLREAKVFDSTSFIEVLVRPGHRANIGRPTSSPLENKNALINTLRF